MNGINLQTARRMKIRAPCGQSIMASDPAQARLLWAIFSLVFPVTFGHATVCRSPALTFSAATYLAMRRSAPCSAISLHSPSSSTAVVHWSELIPKALRPSRKHSTHCFSCPPTQPAPPTSSPNITKLGSLVSSMRTTNPAKIHLPRIIASMLSLPVFISVSR